MRTLFRNVPALTRWTLGIATLLVLGYGLGSLCGLRELCTVLTGTVPAGTSRGTAYSLALIYVTSHLACWIAAPVLVLWGGIYWLAGVALRRVRKPRPRRPARPPDRDAQIGTPGDTR